MALEAVVVGGGPGALRAARGLAARGRSVTLLQEGPHACGHAHADLPPGRGLSAAVGGLAEEVLGAFDEVQVSRAVRLDGRSSALPLTRADVARHVAPTRLPGAALAWGRTRGAAEFRKLIGGGFEATLDWQRLPCTACGTVHLGAARFRRDRNP